MTLFRRLVLPGLLLAALAGCTEGHKSRPLTRKDIPEIKSEKPAPAKAEDNAPAEPKEPKKTPEPKEPADSQDN
jgi:hypothetical protein